MIPKSTAIARVLYKSILVHVMLIDFRKALDMILNYKIPSIWCMRYKEIQWGEKEIDQHRGTK